MIAAKTPRSLWIELTSKCPLDCVFCSRKTRRGAGEHMPYDLFQSLVQQVCDPRTFRLNYSGESTVYPELIPAIRLARSTGAFVELVSALVNVADAALPGLCESGLSRLTVSVHSTDAARYTEIYRYGSYQALHAKLLQFVELCRERAHPPIVDLAFVAMDSNLQDLPAVAALAQSLGLRDISVFPVMRRDNIPVQFPRELIEPDIYRRDFQERVTAMVERVVGESPETALTIGDGLACGYSSPAKHVSSRRDELQTRATCPKQRSPGQGQRAARSRGTISSPQRTILHSTRVAGNPNDSEPNSRSPIWTHSRLGRQPSP